MVITHSKITSLIVFMVLLGTLLTGCASHQAEKLGETAGAALGAITAGFRAGIEGAKIGWNAVKTAQHESRQVRSEQQDRQLYGFSPTTSRVIIKLNKGYSSPNSISPGQQVNIHSDYSLSLPKSYQNNTDVTAVWTVKKDNEIILQTKPVVKSKTAGGHLIEHPFNIPKNAPPGTYVIETRLSSGNAYDVNEAIFVVK